MTTDRPGHCHQSDCMTGRCSNCRASFRKLVMDRAKLRVGREPRQGCVVIEPWPWLCLLAPLPRDRVMCDRHHAWLCSNWGSSTDCRFVGHIKDMCEVQHSEEAKERERGPHQESPGSTVAIVCHNRGSQSITVCRCHLEQPLARTGDTRTTV